MVIIVAVRKYILHMVNLASPHPHPLLPQHPLSRKKAFFSEEIFPLRLLDLGYKSYFCDSLLSISFALSLSLSRRRVLYIVVSGNYKSIMIKGRPPSFIAARQGGEVACKSPLIETNPDKRLSCAPSWTNHRTF